MQVRGRVALVTSGVSRLGQEFSLHYSIYRFKFTIVLANEGVLYQNVEIQTFSLSNNRIYDNVFVLFLWEMN